MEYDQIMRSACEYPAAPGNRADTGAAIVADRLKSRCCQAQILQNLAVVWSEAQRLTGKVVDLLYRRFVCGKVA
jgi:hypothetical protein